MNQATLWVLGHRIRPIETNDSYGMVEVTSPPNVPGPPPHFHKSEHEFFFVLKGALEVMSAGQWRQLPAGGFLELAPNTPHTFINKGAEEAVWLTGWRPRGFERFFRDFGVPAGESGAAERSVSPQLIEAVGRGAQNYGMYISS